jgi:hypothetical protein
MVFNFFASLLLRKILYKLLLASMKTLTNSGDFIGSRIRISNSGGISKRIASIQPLKSRQPIICQ